MYQTRSAGFDSLDNRLRPSRCNSGNSIGLLSLGSILSFQRSFLCVLVAARVIFFPFRSQIIGSQRAGARYISFHRFFFVNNLPFKSRSKICIFLKNNYYSDDAALKHPRHFKWMKAITCSPAGKTFQLLCHQWFEKNKQCTTLQGCAWVCLVKRQYLKWQDLHEWSMQISPNLLFLFDKTIWRSITLMGQSLTM